MAKHIVLIDGNSIAHANNNASTLTVGGIEVQAIFGYLKSIRALRQGLTGDVGLYNLWDGRAQFRLDLYPEYKGNRAALTPADELAKASFKRQQKLIEKALEYLGLPQFRCNHLEADDLADYFVKRLVAAGVEVTLLTGDKDWLQLVQPGVTWFDPIRSRKVDTSNFLEFTGYYTPAAFVQGKALQGDGSDNIPGIEGLGEKGSALFLAQWKSVANFIKAVDSGEHKVKERGKGAKSLHPEQILASPEGRKLFARNVRLMSLAHAPRPAKEDLIVTAKPANVDLFLQFCERLAFRSILREKHAFLDTFGLKAPADVLEDVPF
jgi:DNA polymerase I